MACDGRPQTAVLENRWVILSGGLVGCRTHPVEPFWQVYPAGRPYRMVSRLLHAAGRTPSCRPHALLFPSCCLVLLSPSCCPHPAVPILLAYAAVLSCCPHPVRGIASVQRHLATIAVRSVVTYRACLLSPDLSSYLSRAFSPPPLFSVARSVVTYRAQSSRKPSQPLLSVGFMPPFPHPHHLPHDLYLRIVRNGLNPP